MFRPSLAFALALGLALATTGCGSKTPKPGAATKAGTARGKNVGATPDEGAPQNSGKPAPPLYRGLGAHSWPISTREPEAQRYFDQGLLFMYGFNHDEALRAFTHAADVDPGCAMAQWGIAMANGPHINSAEVDADHARAAWSALQRAKANASGALPVERAVIEAVATRYSRNESADRKPLDRAFAAAMRKAWKSFPADADVGAIYVESLMNLRPWDYWAPNGAAREGLEDMMPTLDRVLEIVPGHPLANHLYVHAMELSGHPEKATPIADRLRMLTPGLGHMVHMPSHIDVRLGKWPLAIDANEKAIAADDVYRKTAPPLGFYAVYMAHNHHMLAYAAMMVGRSAIAIGAIRGVAELFPPETLQEKKLAAAYDGYLAMPLEVLIRFGRWDDVLKEPELKGPFPIYRALRHAARAVAYAAKSDLKNAELARKAFADAKTEVPRDAKFGNNTGVAILEVADKLVSGELLARSGKLDEGIRELREAVRREDALKFNEPPDWIIPVRHALGATLLKAKRAKEAEVIYREDLAKLPDNGWSLWGLARSLKVLGRQKEIPEVDAAFQRVWRQADVELSSSCFCQPGD